MRTTGRRPDRPRIITHPFPLRDDLTAYLRLPEDLPELEARRLARHVRTLAVNGWEETPADECTGSPA